MKCKHTTQNGILSMVRCKRDATRDGYCARHNPDYLSPQAKKALAEYDAKQAHNQVIKRHG